MTHPLLTTERWRRFLDAFGGGIPDMPVEHMRSLASKAYARDPGGWTPVDVPGDFGLQGWGATGSGLTARDVKALVDACGSQVKAAEVAGVSRATVSRAVRGWSPVWDGEFFLPVYGAILMCMYERVPCHFTEAEAAIEALWATLPDNRGRPDWRRHLRGLIALGFIARGSDGKYHLGTGEGATDARKEYEFRPGKMARLCPRDPKHGPSRERYCPKCKARMDRP